MKTLRSSLLAMLVCGCGSVSNTTPIDQPGLDTGIDASSADAGAPDASAADASVSSDASVLSDASILNDAGSTPSARDGGSDDSGPDTSLTSEPDAGSTGEPDAADATAPSSSGSLGEPGSGITSFQEADVVIGQPDFLSNAKPQSLDATVTDYIAGSAAFDGQRLFFSDTYTPRVLGFSSVPTTSGAAADLLFGQAALTATGGGTTLQQLYQPQTLHTDGTTLAIADSGNNRVLLVPTTAASGSAASLVVGWPDAQTPASGCSAARLRSPASAFIVQGKLLVADRANHRVLIWNQLPEANDVSADIVLGQSSLTSCAANDSLHTGTVGLRSESSLNNPTDVWSDGERVLVVDRDNNRVLVWTSFPAANGVPADVVVGQTDFSRARDNADAVNLFHPAALAYDGKLLLIADAGHHRVLGFNALPTANGAAADFVLGQRDFKHTAANDDAQVNSPGNAPTARTLALPSGVTFADGNLVVSDTLNRRVLVFRRH